MRLVVARTIAERAHGDQLDPAGQLLIDHVRRVARSTPRRSRSVAWLHEVFEWTAVPEQMLLTEGLTDDELRALRLLTWLPSERSKTGYRGHSKLIANAAGVAGTLARDVKRADLLDRVHYRT